MNDAAWICCQLGAREHYSIPRALHRQGALKLLVTDFWADPKTGGGFLGRKGRGRFHPDLSDAPVAAFNRTYFVSELFRKLRPEGWAKFTDRNDWFQTQTLKVLKSWHRTNPASATVLFSYSYTARRLFRYAKSVGWTTVLGQIDGGRSDDRRMVTVYSDLADYNRRWEPAPDEYWAGWKEECTLSDTIIVNSDWSRECLVNEGVEPNKLVVLPLAYERHATTEGFERHHPVSFSKDRPLRVLFLGYVSLRKGISVILEALDLVKGLPIELRVVGHVESAIPERFASHPLVTWVGPVPRSAVSAEYQWADVFVFPSFSDGFGLTQLEAQASGLPIIASRYCGRVVTHMHDGYVLEQLDPQNMATALNWFVEDTGRLRSMSSACQLGKRYTLSELGSQLVDVGRSAAGAYSS